MKKKEVKMPKWKVAFDYMGHHVPSGNLHTWVDGKKIENALFDPYTFQAELELVHVNTTYSGNIEVTWLDNESHKTYVSSEKLLNDAIRLRAFALNDNGDAVIHGHFSFYKAGRTTRIQFED